MTDEYNNNNSLNNNIFNPTDSNYNSLNLSDSINSNSINNNFNSIIQLDSNSYANTIDLNSNPISQSKTWKIATQNIRGINDELKQQNWWKFCVENNLDIVAITETKLIKRNNWTIFKEQKITTNGTSKLYHTWWASNTNKNLG